MENHALQAEHMQIQQATRRDASVVVDLVGRLLSELGGFHAFDGATALTLCEQLLCTEHYTAFLARDPQGIPLGVLTLQACPALYVAGYVGWIQEFYVIPEARSCGVGHRLLMEANIYAQERQWRRLEVNTPDISLWPRTVAFYRRAGFAGESYHLKRIPGETS
jgi:GNAT superfamily N-acetyltransferase